MQGVGLTTGFDEKPCGSIPGRIGDEQRQREWYFPDVSCASHSGLSPVTQKSRHGRRYLYRATVSGVSHCQGRLAMTPDRVSTRLDEIYRILWEAYGPQHWWPAEDSLEVMIGAVLTQNTNWQNVEKAIANLKRAGLLAAGSLHALAPDELARFIRPAGYFNIKAQRLKNLIALVAETYGGDLQAMEQAATGELRSKLLAVRGIGPETADSILL
ncbi:MAG: endonuclease III domain-containing protein, partial [Syntrophobacteria bacterium]